MGRLHLSLLGSCRGRVFKSQHSRALTFFNPRSVPFALPPQCHEASPPCISGFCCNGLASGRRRRKEGREGEGGWRRWRVDRRNHCWDYRWYARTEPSKALRALTTVCPGIVILAVMILKYRSYVMRLFGRGSTARGDRMYANEITKDSDLEGNAMKRYPSLDSPIYVSTPALLVHS